MSRARRRIVTTKASSRGPEGDISVWFADLFEIILGWYLTHVGIILEQIFECFGIIWELFDILLVSQDKNSFSLHKDCIL